MHMIYCLLADYYCPVTHYFPTRRSSDLADRVGGLRRRREATVRAPGGRLGARLGRHRGLGAAEPLPAQLARQPGAPRQDRKSTRLNSSHGYISYAVFCLKKKIIMAYY